MQSPTINSIGTREFLHHDLVTFSEVALPTVGVSRYSRDDSTEVLLCAYGFDDGDIKQWNPAQGEKMPAELADALADDRIKKCAFDKPFEDSIWKNVCNITVPEKCWRDPMVMALACALPKKMDKLCQVLGISLDESTPDETKMTRYFCQPSRGERNYWYSDEALWEQIKQYNRRNTIASRRVHKILSNYDLPDYEWAVWNLDQVINQRGIPIDMDMAARAAKTYDAVRDNMRQQICTITGLSNPKNKDGLLYWFEKQGHKFNGLGADCMNANIAQLVSEGVASTDDLYRVLQMYRQINRVAPAKFRTMLELADDDGRVRNAYQYAGAHSGRFAGQGLQPQNLSGPAEGMDEIIWGTSPDGHKVVTASSQTQAAHHAQMFDDRGFCNIYPQPIDALSSAVRPAIKAPDGHVLICTDLKFIEILVLAWLTEDKNLLSIIRAGKDPYLAFASDLYDQSYGSLREEYLAGDKDKRSKAKPGKLGCGFMLGAGRRFQNAKTGVFETTGLLNYAERMGIKLTPDESEHCVKTYRSTNTGVVEYWNYIEMAAKRCVQDKQPVKCGKVIFDIKGNFLRIKLPSGRFLYYFRPRVEPAETSWGVAKNALTYDQDWGKPNPRVVTHPGKLTQNIVSGVARDLFVHGMCQANEAGTNIIMHSHDDIIGIAPIDKADEGLTNLMNSVCARPRWWGDLPITADGYISNRFIKD